MRLKELREENGYTQKEIANVLSVKQNTYSQYENGQREISLSALILLSKFYDTSVDYILSVTNYSAPYPKID